MWCSLGVGDWVLSYSCDMYWRNGLLLLVKRNIMRMHMDMGRQGLLNWRWGGREHGRRSVVWSCLKWWWWNLGRIVGRLWVKLIRVGRQWSLVVSRGWLVLVGDVLNVSLMAGLTLPGCHKLLMLIRQWILARVVWVWVWGWHFNGGRWRWIHGGIWW